MPASDAGGNNTMASRARPGRSPGRAKICLSVRDVQRSLQGHRRQQGAEPAFLTLDDKADEAVAFGLQRFHAQAAAFAQFVAHPSAVLDVDVPQSASDRNHVGAGHRLPFPRYPHTRYVPHLLNPHTSFLPSTSSYHASPPDSCDTKTASKRPTR